MNRSAHPSCADCVHFDNAAAAVERALPGLTSLGSSFAAVRDRDGTCGEHERYLPASAYCSRHEPARIGR